MRAQLEAGAGLGEGEFAMKDRRMGGGFPTGKGELCAFFPAQRAGGAAPALPCLCPWPPWASAMLAGDRSVGQGRNWVRMGPSPGVPDPPSSLRTDVSNALVGRSSTRPCSNEMNQLRVTRKCTRRLSKYQRTGPFLRLREPLCGSLCMLFTQREELPLLCHPGPGLCPFHL